METTLDSLNSTEKPSWFKDAIKNGAILGAIHIVIFVTLYYTATDALAGFAYLGVVMLINFGFIIYMGIQWRNEIGGYMGFGAAFSHAFVLLLTNGILNAIFVMIFGLIESGFVDTMVQIQLDSQLYWAERFGAPQDALDKMRDEFKPDDIAKRYGPVGQLFGIGIVSIFYAIGATISGFVTRKEVPVEM